ncbi:MAG: HAD family hydrolase [Bacteroidales bacterium]|nr:HAD family hydrolase [Bacteroidales bacterium]
MNKAIFLDRDGVINIERGAYTYKINDFNFVPGIFESLRTFQKAGFLLIIVTNQGGIAKQLFTINDLGKLHNFMLKKLKNEKVQITEVYYCPHYTELGKCICRKPDSLLIEKAMARFNIDPKASYFIGDNDKDIGAGEKAGLNTIKINQNQNILEITKQIINSKLINNKYE